MTLHFNYELSPLGWIILSGLRQYERIQRLVPVTCRIPGAVTTQHRKHVSVRRRSRRGRSHKNLIVSAEPDPFSELPPVHDFKTRVESYALHCAGDILRMGAIFSTEVTYMYDNWDRQRFHRFGQQSPCSNMIIEVCRQFIIVQLPVRPGQRHSLRQVSGTLPYLLDSAIRAHPQHRSLPNSQIIEWRLCRLEPYFQPPARLLERQHGCIRLLQAELFPLIGPDAMYIQAIHPKCRIRGILINNRMDAKPIKQRCFFVKIILIFPEAECQI